GLAGAGVALQQDIVAAGHRCLVGVELPEPGDRPADIAGGHARAGDKGVEIDALAGGLVCHGLVPFLGRCPCTLPFKQTLDGLSSPQSQIPASCRLARTLATIVSRTASARSAAESSLAVAVNPGTGRG